MPDSPRDLHTEHTPGADAHGSVVIDSKNRLPAVVRDRIEEVTMRRKIAIATGVAAGVTALALVAAPALAQVGTWTGGRSAADTTCPMWGSGSIAPVPGYGMARGQAQPQGIGRSAVSPGMGRGGAAAVPSGTLTSAQQSALAAMADEEKLALDLYTVLATTYPADVQFARIARSEAMHLSAVRTLLARYGIADPTAGLSAGQFSSSRTQSLYTSLLASATSSASALAAGVAVEKDDIAALNSAKAGVTAPDVLAVYGQLLSGSQRHLAAFGG